MMTGNMTILHPGVAVSASILNGTGTDINYIKEK
jgi:hypothetical protein